MAPVNVKNAPAPLASAAEALIVKGKEQGFLLPRDILAGFADVELDPDQLLGIFDVFRHMRIEVWDGETEVEGVFSIDDDLIATIGAIGWASQLTADQEVTLAKAIEAGDNDAKLKLEEANLGLVNAMVQRFIPSGVSFLDLMLKGHMGLSRALETFDYSKGYRFSTYATWWIRRAINRAIANQAPRRGVVRGMRHG